MESLARFRNKRSPRRGIRVRRASTARFIYLEALYEYIMNPGGEVAILREWNFYVEPRIPGFAPETPFKRKIRFNAPIRSQNYSIQYRRRYESSDYSRLTSFAGVIGRNWTRRNKLRSIFYAHVDFPSSLSCPRTYRRSINAEYFIVRNLLQSWP